MVIEISKLLVGQYRNYMGHSFTNRTPILYYIILLLYNIII